MLYDGDLHQYDKVLSWLTSQDVFEIKNEIEEVNRKMLDKLLEENEFLTVYFCESSVAISRKQKLIFHFSVFSRAWSRRKYGGAGEAREHRQRDRQPGHHVREDGRFAICTKMGRHEAAGLGLLPQALPQYLSR